MEVNQRCSYNPLTKSAIVRELKTFLHQNNKLIKLFKIVLDRMQSDTIVFRTDQVPSSEHAKKVQLVDNPAIVIV